MPSFGDTALIALLALLLFGPKKLPELARQLGKLMAEFRRASNEFRMQMEDELRVSEQEEQRKKIAAMEAAAPVTPPLVQDESIVVDHPHQPAIVYEERVGEEQTENSIAAPVSTDAIADASRPDRSRFPEAAATPTAAPLPIATSGELSMMPPATGLPVSRSAASPLGPVLEAIPHTANGTQPDHEASLHG